MARGLRQLLENEGTSGRLKVSLAQGRWREEWGGVIGDIPPAGAVVMGEKNSDWNSLGLHLAGLFCGSFSIGKKNGVEIGDMMVKSAPQEPACTENVSAILRLLPCHKAAGLAQQLPSSVAIASAMYFAIIFEFSPAKNEVQLSIILGGVDMEQVNTAESSKVCAKSAPPTYQFYSLSGEPEPVASFESLANRKMKADRTDNSVAKSEVTRFIQVAPNRSPRSHGIYTLEAREGGRIFADHFPRFILPEWNAVRVFTKDGKVHEGADAIRLLQANTTLEGGRGFSLMLPADGVKLHLPLTKLFVHLKDFVFAAEKGFDWGSAAMETESGDLHVSSGSLVMVQMPDFSMPFNVLYL